MSTPAVSPAEQYARFRERQAAPEFTSFRELYDFEFDQFQVAACGALTAGDGVLVAAPTGSGKTVVGEYAVHLALQQGRKCFYTTPIKALSNQKYNDLVRRYDADTVGLLTGDNSVNGNAPVVVMTTEVLRNMLYAGSPSAARPRLRRARRGALPGGPRPRRGVGRGHHPPARVGAGGGAVGDGEQRRGVRRLAVSGARRHRRDRRRAPAGAAVAAHAGRPPALRPVHRRRPPRGEPGADQTGAAGDLPGVLAGVRVRLRAGPRRRARRPGLPVPAAGAAVPARHHRPAGRRGAAARDHVHLQPRGLRRRGPAVPGRRAAADHAGRGVLHRVGGGAAHRRHSRRGPRRPRVPRLGHRAAPGDHGAPRRDAARLQGGRGGAVRRRPGPRRVRDGDAGARREHAGQDRRHRTARQVERRGARGAHAGGVHPAHRPGRAARYRRGRARGRALASGRRPGLRGRPGRHPHLPAELQLPPLLQHGRQPDRAGRAGPRRDPARVVVRAVPGRQGRRRPEPQAAPGQGLDGRAGGVDDLRSRRLPRLRRNPAPAHRRRARRVPQPRLGAARGGPPRARHAAPRRHHPGAVRAAGRHGRGAHAAARRGRAACPRRRPAGAHRAGTAQAAVRGRLPGAGRACRAAPGAELVQRALAQAPPRPRLLDAQQAGGQVFRSSRTGPS